jgi:hypothetical protein
VWLLIDIRRFDTFAMLTCTFLLVLVASFTSVGKRSFDVEVVQASGPAILLSDIDIVQQGTHSPNLNRRDLGIRGGRCLVEKLNTEKAVDHRNWRFARNVMESCCHGQLNFFVHC